MSRQSLSRVLSVVARLACFLAVIVAASACPNTAGDRAWPAPVAGSPEPIAPDALVWEIERDEAGRVIRSVDPAGRATTVAYDLHSNGRVRRMARTLPDGSQAIHEIDAEGRPVRAVRGDHEIAYAYDTQGRLASLRRTGLPSVSFGYDTLNRITLEKVGRSAIKYQYDILGRLKEITTPAGPVTYEYAPGQRMIVRALPTGHRTVLKYDARGRLQLVEHSNARKELVARYEYEWRPDGRLLKAQETSPDAERAIRYEYDTLGELTRATDSAGSTATFSYDAFGNRISATRSGGGDVAALYDFAGRLTGLAGKPCRNDAAGSLIACDSRDVELTHGADGALVRVARGSTAVEYRYDASGAMVERTVGAHKESFFPDPTSSTWRPLVAKEKGGVETLYLWENSTLIGALRGGKATFFLPDQLGSVRLVVDGKGAIVAQRAYDPFGVPDKGAAADIEPGFGGLFYDAAAGLYLTRTRAYDPEIGRFVERDPELRPPGASAEDLSAYAYCGNDPVNGVDPTGERQSDPPLHASNPNVYYVTVPKIDFSEYGLAKDPNFRGGRAGNEYTRLQNHLIAADLERQGFTITHMHGWPSEAGGVLKERYLPPVPGSEVAGGRNFIDIVAVKGDTSLFVSTQSTDKQGALRETMQDTSVIAKLKDAGVHRGTVRLSSWPSDVGGVALEGASSALAGLGQVTGVALDDNQRIVLLTNDATNVRLPPMELDDIVTVFRAVYTHGESPLVSIDPDPKSPLGPTFNVRYGQGLERTYVGWVLFEADRRMKAYSLGTDNVTNQHVSSRVPGYRSVTEMQADANSTPPGASAPKWERFWIVPSGRRERQTPSGALSLLDVPLRVNTQVMKLSGGKLEPLLSEPPSLASKRFADWFTSSYDALGNDPPSPLPAGHRRAYDHVNVFEELRRIALLTAAAEKLRGDGVPLPSWVRARRVEPFPAPARTPRIEILKDVGKVRLSLAGGVSLDTPKSAIVRQASAEATQVAGALTNALPAGAFAAPTKVRGALDVTKAIAFPGAGTRDVGALVEEEKDVELPLANGDTLVLARMWSSFFDPEGELGRGWSLDLPTLSAQWESFSEGDTVRKQRVPVLWSPLETRSARFTKLAEVP